MHDNDLRRRRHTFYVNLHMSLNCGPGFTSKEKYHIAKNSTLHAYIIVIDNEIR